MSNESPKPLRPCRHRGVEFFPGRWHCNSRKLIVPGRWVTQTECAEHCPYVDQVDSAERERSRLGMESGQRVPEPIRVTFQPERLAVAVITAPRAERTVEQTLAQLRFAGYPGEIHVIQEPGTDVQEGAGVRVHTNNRPLGLWLNWCRAAQWLLDETNCPYLLICEDDIALAQTAMLGLQFAMDTLPRDTLGLASLFTASHHTTEMELRFGWQAQVGGEHWGALAYCFPRSVLDAVLRTSTVDEHRHEPRGHTDILVGAAVKELGLSSYFHLPSLADHTGSGVSTIDHGDMHWVRGWGFGLHLDHYQPG